MRLSILAALCLVFSAQASMASKGGHAKNYSKICKEENPGASKSLIKKCVKDKKKEDKNK